MFDEENERAKVKYLDIKQFRELGYLQELNRRFLHPLGLALEVQVAEDGSEERLGGVWDYRHDPEGMSFGRGVIDPVKVVMVADEWDAKAEVRQEKLGYVIQPPR